ncbi:hypothetical protein D3369_15815 [Salmonella enterica]|nr:hypothetical protein [Salmonella enterica]EBM7083483.1 hypothetical protein [Salmonella enterica]EBN0566449.1 hypothetical protein [Salmonella enterica]EBN1081759.1 hypothetical protein [Salmonella enterica]
MLFLSPLPLSLVWDLSLIHFILQAASVLTAFTRPSHVFMYAPGARSAYSLATANLNDFVYRSALLTGT